MKRQKSNDSDGTLSEAFAAVSQGSKFSEQNISKSELVSKAASTPATYVQEMEELIDEKVAASKSSAGPRLGNIVSGAKGMVSGAKDAVLGSAKGIVFNLWSSMYSTSDNHDLDEKDALSVDMTPSTSSAPTLTVPDTLQTPLHTDDIPSATESSSFPGGFPSLDVQTVSPFDGLNGENEMATKLTEKKNQIEESLVRESTKNVPALEVDNENVNLTQDLPSRMSIEADSRYKSVKSTVNDVKDEILASMKDFSSTLDIFTKPPAQDQKEEERGEVTEYLDAVSVNESFEVQQSPEDIIELAVPSLPVIEKSSEPIQAVDNITLYEKSAEDNISVLEKSKKRSGNFDAIRSLFLVPNLPSVDKVDQSGQENQDPKPILVETKEKKPEILVVDEWVKADPKAVGIIVDMGFPKSVAELVLVRCGNDVKLATDYILNHPEILSKAESDFSSLPMEETTEKVAPDTISTIEPIQEIISNRAMIELEDPTLPVKVPLLTVAEQEAYEKAREDDNRKRTLEAKRSLSLLQRQKQIALQEKLDREADQLAKTNAQEKLKAVHAELIHFYQLQKYHMQTKNEVSNRKALLYSELLGAGKEMQVEKQKKTKNLVKRSAEDVIERAENEKKKENQIFALNTAAAIGIAAAAKAPKRSRSAEAVPVAFGQSIPVPQEMASAISNEQSLKSLPILGTTNVWKSRELVQDDTKLIAMKAEAARLKSLAEQLEREKELERNNAMLEAQSKIDQMAAEHSLAIEMAAEKARKEAEALHAIEVQKALEKAEQENRMLLEREKREAETRHAEEVKRLLVMQEEKERELLERAAAEEKARLENEQAIQAEKERLALELAEFTSERALTKRKSLEVILADKQTKIDQMTAEHALAIELAAEKARKEAEALHAIEVQKALERVEQENRMLLEREKREAETRHAEEVKRLLVMQEEKERELLERAAAEEKARLENEQAIQAEKERLASEHATLTKRQNEFVKQQELAQRRSLELILAEKAQKDAESYRVKQLERVRSLEALELQQKQVEQQKKRVHSELLKIYELRTLAQRFKMQTIENKKTMHVELLNRNFDTKDDQDDLILQAIKRTQELEKEKLELEQYLALGTKALEDQDREAAANQRSLRVSKEKAETYRLVLEAAEYERTELEMLRQSSDQYIQELERLRYEKAVVERDLTLLRSASSEALASRDVSVKATSYTGDVDLLQENVVSRNMVEENVAVRNVIQENVAVRNVIQENVAVRDVVEENIAVRNVVEENIAVRNVVQENIAVRNVVEENIAVRDVVEENIAVRNVVEENIAVRNVVEENIAVRNVVEENIAVRDVIEENIAVLNSVEENVVTRNIVQENVAVRNVMEENVVSLNIVEENIAARNMIEENTVVRLVEDDSDSDSPVSAYELASKRVLENAAMTQNPRQFIAQPISLESVSRDPVQLLVEHRQNNYYQPNNIYQPIVPPPERTFSMNLMNKVDELQASEESDLDDEDTIPDEIVEEREPRKSIAHKSILDFMIDPVDLGPGMEYHMLWQEAERRLAAKERGEFTYENELRHRTSIGSSRPPTPPPKDFGLYHKNSSRSSLPMSTQSQRRFMVKEERGTGPLCCSIQ